MKYKNKDKSKLQAKDQPVKSSINIKFDLIRMATGLGAPDCQGVQLKFAKEGFKC